MRITTRPRTTTKTTVKEDLQGHLSAAALRPHQRKHHAWRPPQRRNQSQQLRASVRARSASSESAPVLR